MQKSRKFLGLFLLISALILMAFGCAGKQESAAEAPGNVSEDLSLSDQKAEASESEKVGSEEIKSEEAEEPEDKTADSEEENKKEDKKVEKTQKKEEDMKAEDKEVKEPVPVPESDAEFVRVKDFIPDIVVDLKYATSDNFTGEVIYDFTDAYLRYGTVKKLKKVQKAVKKEGMLLKIWDAFRPFYAQQRLWDVYPDPVYVADPAKGIGGHCTGGTIDITLVYEDGSDVEMPTGFDDFSVKADRDYSDCSLTEAGNAMYLEQVMYENGFHGYAGEWWDFTDDAGYVGDDGFEPPHNE